MTTPTSPKRFDPRNIFLATGWNVFVVFVGLFALWAAGGFLWDAYSQARWWPVAGWAFATLMIAHAVWTSASRLWHARANRAPTE